MTVKVLANGRQSNLKNKEKQKMKHKYIAPQTAISELETVGFIAQSVRNTYSVTMDGEESGLTENTTTHADCSDARSKGSSDLWE